MIYDALIIGGGASGLMAAWALSAAGARTALLEKQLRVGRKLLSTGNGRCNFTNLGASPTDYHGDAALIRAALAAWPPERIVRVFERLGVLSRPDEAGRVYPASGQAAAVLDALRLAADEAGCETVAGFEVRAIVRKKGIFAAQSAAGQALEGRRVLCCGGGLVAPKLGASGALLRLLEGLGHGVAPLRPALTPLKTPPEAVRALKGLRAQCDLTLLADGAPVRTERGEVLFADYGVSGIAAMNLARAAGDALARGRRAELSFDFLAGLRPPEEAPALVGRLASALPERPAEDLLTGVVPKRVGQALLKAAGIFPMNRPAGTLSEGEIRALARCLSGWRLAVTGTQGFEQAQVTAGGLRGGDFDPQTLESRIVPGLYAAGELLDVDGDCGGYNLQWAWASALLAAEALLRSLDRGGFAWSV